MELNFALYVKYFCRKNVFYILHIILVLLGHGNWQGDELGKEDVGLDGDIDLIKAT